MHSIKKLIREELQRVISVLSENGLYKNVDYAKASKPDNGKEDIIYNYEKGRVFAGDSLEVDIVNLNRYGLVEYLPKSVTEEMWSFEFDTVHGTVLIVDVKRNIVNDVSIWTMKFGQLYKGEQTPILMGELGPIEGYENFVNSINKGFASKIDPSKY